MKNTEIKIVGAITDENALEEIESIAKVFAYEQRMKDYTSILPIKIQTKNVSKIQRKKIRDNIQFFQSSHSRILVKGLC